MPYRIWFTCCALVAKTGLCLRLQNFIEFSCFFFSNVSLWKLSFDLHEDDHRCHWTNTLTMFLMALCHACMAETEWCNGLFHSDPVDRTWWTNLICHQNKTGCIATKIATTTSVVFTFRFISAGGTMEKFLVQTNWHYGRAFFAALLSVYGNVRSLECWLCSCLQLFESCNSFIPPCRTSLWSRCDRSWPMGPLGIASADCHCERESKSILTNSLISKAGNIAKATVDARFTDTGTDEQEWGVTIESTGTFLLRYYVFFPVFI